MKNIIYTLFVGVCMIFALNANAQNCFYTVNVQDTFGDGWAEGQVLTVTSCQGTSTYSAAGSGLLFVASSEDYKLATCDGAPIDWSTNAAFANFAGEHAFSITGPTGDVCVNSPFGATNGASAGACTAICPCAGGPGDCAVDISLTAISDSFGDGWQGNMLTVSVAGAPIFGPFTVATPGDPGQVPDMGPVNITVPVGDCVDLEVLNSGDTFPGEVEYTLNVTPTPNTGGAAITFNGVTGTSLAYTETGTGVGGVGTNMVTAGEICCPAPLASPLAQCGIVCLGKANTIQDLCVIPPSCGPGNGCTTPDLSSAIIATASATLALGIDDGASLDIWGPATPFGCFSTMTVPFPAAPAATAGGDPCVGANCTLPLELAGATATICWNGDSSFSGEDVMVGWNTAAPASECGNFGGTGIVNGADGFIDGIGADCEADQCLTFTVPAAQIAAGAVTVWFRARNNTSLEDFCTTVGASSDEMTLTVNAEFVDPCTAIPDAACIEWFGDECALDAIADGSCLSLDVVQGLIDAGCLPGVSLASAGSVTLFAEAVCADGSRSARIAVNLSIYDCDIDGGCPYFLVMDDAGGDGWDGAVINVSINEVWPATPYKVTSGACETAMLVATDGGFIDLEYWNGANEAEHSWKLLDAFGNIALMTNGNCTAFGPNPPVGVTHRVKADCPENTCNGTVDHASKTANPAAGIEIGDPVDSDFCARVTMGAWPEFISWEIYEGPCSPGVDASNNSQGPRVFWINATFYEGNPPGTTVDHAIPAESFDFCQEYTIHLMDGFNTGWNGADWTLFTNNPCYGPAGNQVLDPTDPKFGWFNLFFISDADFPNDGGAALPNADYYECFTIPCKPECPPASIASAADPNTCLSTTNLTLPIPEAEVCYPQCNHGLGCDIVADFELLVNGDPFNGIFFDVDFTPGTDAFFGPGLPVGCHKGIWYLEYCDGIISRCTFDFTISIDANPTMVCNDNVTISLKAPDANPLNGGFAQDLYDDLDECVIKITPDMVLEAGVGDNCAFNEYSITILDENGVPLEVLSSRGNPLDDTGREILPELYRCPLIPSNCLVGSAQVKQTLTYVIEHKPSGNKCWGELTVEDKTPPLVLCTDYSVNCNDPEAYNEDFSETVTFDAAPEMPANIAGGFGGPGQSNTWIPVNVVDQCWKKGTLLTDIKINLNMIHNEISDVAVNLHLPSGLVALGFPSVISLDTNGDTGSQNCYVPNPVNDAPGLLALVAGTVPCTALESPSPEDFVTENTGSGALPGNYGGTWYIQVIDNGVSFPDPPFGAGEVTSASITFTCEFPTPCVAIDCSLESFEQISEVYVDTDCDQANWEGGQIHRVYKATDCFGNSTTATQIVGLCAPPMSELEFPGDIELECEGLTADEIGVEQAGGLIFACEPLTEEHHAVCDISYTYWDHVIPTCGQGFKIVRDWTIINWCSGTTKYHTQQIKVEDTVGPTVPDASATIGTAGYECSGELCLDDLGIEDACSGVLSVSAKYLISGSPYLGNDQYAIVDLLAGDCITGLGLGLTEVEITATDSCYKKTVLDIIVTTVDDSAPTAVCDDDLHISLNGDGVARLYATDFDEGSSDNCGDVTLEIRSLGCAGAGWGEYADFACCDLGDHAVTVELRVTDAAGNTNICWADLLIEDPLAPIVICKDDLTLDCNDPAFNDPFTEPDAIDNCAAVLINTQDGGSLDNCHAGTLTRTWTYSDGSDKSADASCTQRVTFEHISDFTVQFPPDITIDTCPDDTGDTGAPIILDDDCELVAINYEDQLLGLGNNGDDDASCFKILRKWTLINWCVYDDSSTPTDGGIPLPLPNTFRDDDGYFYYVQTIKVIDEDAPTVDMPTPDPCDFTDGCEGFVELIAVGEDDCSTELEYHYTIDAFSDGTVDITGDGEDASGVYPYGCHTITWNVGDNCGNWTTGEFEFCVEDCKNPTPVCLHGISVEVMNDGDGCVPIWATDLLEYAFDNCDEDEDIEASVLIRRCGDTGPPQTQIEVCCDDVPAGIVCVEVWVTDSAGNSDYCETYIVPQDNLGNCPGTGGGSAAIKGDIVTEDYEDVDQVMVDINGTAAANGVTGEYNFPNLNVGSSYTVTPEKDIKPLNGVSTYDLVLISQHIIGTSPLTSPYQLIAADVNNSGTITTFDMVQLRQLILFVISDFPSNNSWRFVDMDYVFPVPTNPWLETFPEVINVASLPASGELLADFFAVKIGDINGSANPNTLLGTNGREMPTTLVLNVDNTEMVAGETYTVDFMANDFTNISGYQFTMNFDRSAVEFVGTTGGALNVSDKNFGTSLLDEGVITTSYNEATAMTVGNDETLFSITFTAKANAFLNDVISVNSKYTQAEAYSADGELKDVAIGFNTTNGTVIAGGAFELLQNKPNPFNESTVIGFNLPEATAATLKVFDVSGKMMRVIEGDFARGYNEVSIDRADLQATGVLYYQLDTDTDSATKKMILLD